MAEISQEARELLAQAFEKKAERKQREANLALAMEIRKGWSSQYNTPLQVITQALATPVKYCRYDLPTVDDIDENCECNWCAIPSSN